MILLFQRYLTPVSYTHLDVYKRQVVQLHKLCLLLSIVITLLNRIILNITERCKRASTEYKKEMSFGRNCIIINVLYCLLELK